MRISEDLIRRRAEHNECLISTLEEISLHQQDIEKIEFIDKWCKHLKILYLQKNVSKLKKLQYLNLALNNIEVIENLEGCESLKKLDLTVNFIGQLTSVDSLKRLIFFEELFLTGNPCTDFDGYRDYVIATLPHLKFLDGKTVGKTERILATQKLELLKKDILEQEENYRFKRQKEKEDAEQRKQPKEEPGFDGRWYTDINESDRKSNDNRKEENREELEKKFWEETTSYTPESRLEVHEHVKKLKEKEEEKNEKPKKPPRRLFADDGRPLNVNEPKVDFELKDDDEAITLDVAVFKHMDSSLLDLDVQPLYVLQLTLPEEIRPDRSEAQRSKTTGHLVISMPKVCPILRPGVEERWEKTETKKIAENSNLLEVDPKSASTVQLDFVKTGNFTKPYSKIEKPSHERVNSEDFVDNPDVPPLM